MVSDTCQAALFAHFSKEMDRQVELLLKGILIKEDVPKFDAAQSWIY